MSGVLARRQENINEVWPLEDTDEELMEQMAIKMAGLLPDDPQQGARVLTLVSAFYAALTERREQTRAH